eukprot:8807607-Pyramimonas_sp.AAC.1
MPVQRRRVRGLSCRRLKVQPVSPLHDTLEHVRPQSVHHVALACSRPPVQHPQQRFPAYPC